MDTTKLRLHRDTLRVLVADLQARVERGERLLAVLQKDLDETHLELWHAEDELAIAEAKQENETVPIIVSNEEEIPF